MVGTYEMFRGKPGMRQALTSGSMKIICKALHSIAVCGWIGGGLAILILLKLAGNPGGSQEAIAFQRSIKAIDEFLITPSAGLATLTGLYLCVGKPWGFRGHRWITEKCAITTVLLIFGAFWLAPGLQSLAPPDSWHLEFGAAYHRTWLWGAVAATLQTSILVLLVGLSILKPDKGKDRHI
jgi:putative copper export protein